MWPNCAGECGWKGKFQASEMGRGDGDIQAAAGRIVSNGLQPPSSKVEKRKAEIHERMRKKKTTNANSGMENEGPSFHSPISLMAHANDTHWTTRNAKHTPATFMGRSCIFRIFYLFKEFPANFPLSVNFLFSVPTPPKSRTLFPVYNQSNTIQCIIIVFIP